MLLNLTIKDETIAGVLEGAGISHWCKNLKWEEFKPCPGIESCWDALLAGTIHAVQVISKFEPKHRFLVTRFKILKAFQIILEKYPLGDDRALPPGRFDAPAVREPRREGRRMKVQTRTNTLGEFCVAVRTGG